MKSFAEQIFFGAIIELVSLMVSYVFKDKPRTAIVIFALGTLGAGFIAFTPFFPPENPVEPTKEPVIITETPIPILEIPTSTKTHTPTPLPPTSTQSTPYLHYSVDFQGAVDNLWSVTTTTQAPNGEFFLGEFYNQTISFRLNNLPHHKELTLTYDLYIIGTWDGTYPSDLDLWQLAIDDDTIIYTTFDNQDFYADHSQAFPGDYPNAVNRPRTGADKNNSLGYSLGDTIYSMSYIIPHSSNSLIIEFIASNLEGGITDESWGIDNVSIYINK